jgi:CheY-like chemotaxis protein
MASLSQIVARICEDLIGPMREASRTLENLRQAGLGAEAERRCDEALQASARVLTLLETAAELRKAEMGELTLDFQPRRLRELMDEVEARWSAPAEQAGVRLLVSYDGDPDCAVMVDWPRLKLAIDALVGRAVAIIGSRVIEVSLATRLGEQGFVVTCRVRDDGVLAEGADALQFLPAAASLDSGKGIDVTLGLALATYVITAMGGRLGMHRNVGPGASLDFELVLLPPRPSDRDPDARAPAGRTAHILVVDDNATNRMVVEALCDMFECSTESVGDGVEAIEAARVGRFDVILMDIKMPRMDGLTATSEIRKLPGAAGRAPIIALTANAGADDVRTYLAAGMCSVVEKPIKAERLLEALENALADSPSPDQRVAAA